MRNTKYVRNIDKSAKNNKNVRGKFVLDPAFRTFLSHK